MKGGEKISVAGRTGVGKSSFVAALLRMPDAIEEARRCVSVLSQVRFFLAVTWERGSVIL